MCKRRERRRERKREGGKEEGGRDLVILEENQR